MSARRFCIGVAVGAALALAAVGCGGKTKTNQNNNGCPEGFEARDSACVPIFDECPGPVEIPVLGGGCRPVGVIQCGTGFVSDGEGGCEPVLPSDPCPAGTVEVIGETECQPVGVTDCAPSFVSDGEGGCDAILPLFPCASGTIEILGETECQPLGDCGSAPWGNIPIDGSTVFVDETADPTSADGSQSNPFPSVNEALAAVTSGGRIAVAEGEYAERLIISKPVELIGRCADLVTLRGTMFLGQPRPPVTINSAGTGTTIRGVTLTGDGQGLLLQEAQQVTVEEVQVLDTGSYGINAFNEAEASLIRVVVARCTEEGILSTGATISLTESVVRDTRPLGGGNLGRGDRGIMRAQRLLRTRRSATACYWRAFKAFNR